MRIRTVISQIVFVACVLFGIGVEQANPWVQGGLQPFLDGEAPVVLHRFCRLSSGVSSRWCSSDSDQIWVNWIEDAISEWNEAGANFLFLARPVRDTDDPCDLQGAVVVIFASPDNPCPGDSRFSITPGGGLAVKTQGGNWARIYIFDGGPLRLDASFHSGQSILLHELGHVVGLDHPDEAGQNVRAIMNSTINYGTLLPDDIAGIHGLHGTRRTLPVGVLENPAGGQSGIGVISGWVCEAERVEIRITRMARPRPWGDDDYHTGVIREILRFDAAYGTERTDTAEECGDTDNGFSFLFNWNRLGDGVHQIRAVVDGVFLEWDWERWSPRGVIVKTLGQEFVRGLSGSYPVPNLRAGYGSPQGLVPWEGNNTSRRLVWSEALQNFVIADGLIPVGVGDTAGDVTSQVLENPGSRSYQSGIGVISGWVCEAETVEVVLTPETGEVLRLEAAYGTERTDTADVCGDTDNGFGLLFNWNRLGDGEHMVELLVDGEAVAQSTIRVTTLDGEFVRGLFGGGCLAGFPTPEETVRVRWQESQQNFAMYLQGIGEHPKCPSG